MRKLNLSVLLIFPILGSAQSVIGNVNSGAVSGNSFSHSVGEIYVIPTNPDDANSGTMGILYQTTLKVLGISEILKDNIQIYPNPTTDFIYLKLSSKNKIDEAVIYDNSGRLILKTKIESDKIDLRSLNIGIYLLYFTNTDIKPIKIIKK